MRSRKHILGLPSVPPAHRLELNRANEITRRTAVLLMAAHRSGAEFVVENPVDRGNASHPLFFQFAEHGPIWLDPFMQELARSCSTESATFAQCMLGAASQKYTTLWFTAGLAPALRPLRQLVCSHAPGTHTAPAGGLKNEHTSVWNSTLSASYPPDFNLFITDAVVQFFSAAQVLEPEATPPPTITRKAPPDIVADHTALRPAHNPAPASKPAPHEPRPHSLGADFESAPSDAVATAGDGDDLRSSSPVGDAQDVIDPKPAMLPAKVPFRRGLGPIHLRPRHQTTGSAHVARSNASPSDPTTHAEAMARDAVGWGASEVSEIANHERAKSWE